MSTRDGNEFRRQAKRLEGLIAAIEHFTEPEARAQTREIVQGILDLHSAALDAMLGRIAATGEAGLALIDALASDNLIGSLLVLYGLHPEEIDTRVGRALERVRPYLHSHGGDVELVGVTEGVVKLRMQGSCHGCPSSAMTLKLAIEDAIYEEAPDVTALEVEGVAARPENPSSAFLPVIQLHGANGAGRTSAGWKEVDGARSIPEGSTRTQEVSGHLILLCRVEGVSYAFEPTCPGCGRDLDDARLDKTTLVCGGCDRHYDIRGAGRGLDDSSLHLEPFPLLVEHDRTTVALPY